MDLRAKTPTQPTEFSFKFRDRLLVTDLVVRSGRANFNQFTDWLVEGSVDGIEYAVLYEGKEATQWRSWHQVYRVSLGDVGVLKFCSHFRFSFFSAAISLSGVEFYGLVVK